MKVIEIFIEGKIAVSTDEKIVCGNSDYYIKFIFSEEWHKYTHKTARFIYNGKFEDVVFEGDTVNVPVLRNTLVVAVGVFAGDLKTTTPALVGCAKSILCEGGIPTEPTPDVYAQILAICENAVATAESVEQRANAGEFDGKDADVRLCVPRMSVIDETDGNNAVEDYKGEGVKFADAYNRVYVELSKGRGVSARYCLTAGTNVPLDPDPEDFASGKKLDSIPLRMDDGFIRVPISEYGKTQPTVGDDGYDEDQRAMSKKYIDSGIESRLKKASNSSDLNQLYGELSKGRGNTMFAVCNGPTASSDHIPQRTKDGLMRCNTPEDGADNICSNKGYVDNFAKELLAGLDSIIAAQNELLGG